MDTVINITEILRQDILNFTFPYNTLKSRNTEEIGSSNSHLHNAVWFEDLSKIKALTETTQNINVKNRYGLTPLHFCLFNSNTNIVDYLISKGANVEEPDHSGNTLLHYAIRQENEVLLDKLITKKVQLNTPNEIGATPLRLAIKMVNPVFVGKLLDNGADVNQKDYLLNTPLHFACDSTVYSLKATLIIDRILETGVDVNEQNIKGDTPLHLAARQKNIAVVKKLLEKGADVKIQNRNGNTPLLASVFLMCQGNDSEHVLKLLGKGIDINCRNDKEETLLHVACICDSYEMTEMLLKREAAVNCQDSEGNIPLHFARSSNIVEKLIEKGANVNCRNYNGNTPLHEACERGSYETCEALLQNGAEGNLQNRIGKTSLHIARSTNIVECLLNKGADSACRNEAGNTPLHIACECDNYEITEILLDKGAEVNVVNVEGRSPLHLAYSTNIVECLLNKGADINCQDITGSTILHRASCDDNQHITEILLDKGAKTNLQNIEGDTPLHLIESLNIMERLIHKGADWSICNNRGNTALHNFVIGKLELYKAVVLVSSKHSDIIRLSCLVDEVNIDMKNNEGNTALHIAAANNDNAWIRCLLDMGAAIDIKNNENKTPYQIAPMFLPLFAIKSKLAGLLDDPMLQVTDEVNITRIHNELEVINNIFVLPQQPVSVIFSKRNNPYYLSDCDLNSALERFFEHPNSCRLCPMYFSILKNTFKKTKRRLQLLNTSFQSLYHSNRKSCVRLLPEIVKTNLLKYLDNESLYNLSKSI